MPVFSTSAQPRIAPSTSSEPGTNGTTMPTIPTTMSSPKSAFMPGSVYLPPDAPEPGSITGMADITRRRLIGAAAATAAGAALPAADAAAAIRKKKVKKPAFRRRTADVVVVGAGLAGLTAARDLVAAGSRSSCSRRATASAGACSTSTSAAA